eukprot:6492807-Amphidinium_carterae.3
MALTERSPWLASESDEEQEVGCAKQSRKRKSDEGESHDSGSEGGESWSSDMDRITEPGTQLRPSERLGFWAEELQALIAELPVKQAAHVRVMTACSGTGAPILALKVKM